MFDTMYVAKKIREARISQNMTQMNLADAMGVSYQAVSNWERGNSMPDIGKLEQLCRILNISIEELLGTDTTAQTLNKIIYQDETASEAPITMEELEDVIPLLPPNEAKKLLDERLRQEQEKTIDFSTLIGIAPFLDTAYLDELVKRAHVNSLEEVTALAPFLSQEALGSLVMQAPLEDISGIPALAPFLSARTLDALVQRFGGEAGVPQLTALAPFLSRETLDIWVEGYLEKGPFDYCLSGLYPFLSQKTLKRIAETLMKKGDIGALQTIVPFCQT